MPEIAGRLLVFREAAGALHMAVDEAVSGAVGSGTAPPTLRFYAWRPAAVSLGYAQRVESAVDPVACARRGLQIVRRPTGGRAVLHGDDLDYSLALPRGGWPGCSVRESSRRIADGLVEGLRALGVEACLADGPPAPGRSPACFASPSGCEVVVGARKLVGSAQRRTHQALLQQGALLLRLDPALSREVLRGADLDGRAVGLEELLGHPPDPRAVAAALAEGLGRTLGIRWRAGGLHPAEEGSALYLAASVYGSGDWTQNRIRGPNAP